MPIFKEDLTASIPASAISQAFLILETSSSSLILLISQMISGFASILKPSNLSLSLRKVSRRRSSKPTIFGSALLTLSAICLRRVFLS